MIFSGLDDEHASTRDMIAALFDVITGIAI